MRSFIIYWSISIILIVIVMLEFKYNPFVYSGEKIWKNKWALREKGREKESTIIIWEVRECKSERMIVEKSIFWKNTKLKEIYKYVYEYIEWVSISLIFLFLWLVHSYIFPYVKTNWNRHRVTTICI